MTEHFVLRCQKLTKRFGGLTAVDNVTIEFPSNGVTGVIGPNGSGKTTLFNMLVGFLRPSEGSITWGDESIANRPPHVYPRMGLVRTFQSAEVFKEITVAESLNFALARATGHKPRMSGAELLAFVGLEDDLAVRSMDLPYGHQKLLGLALALAVSPRLLLMDEPAAGLNAAEVQRLLALIGEIQDDFGIGVAVIDHDMSLIMPACDSVTVLDFGQVIASGPPDVVQEDPTVIDVYLGAEA